MLPSCAGKIQLADFTPSKILLQIRKIIANRLVARLNLLAQFPIATLNSIAATPSQADARIRSRALKEATHVLIIPIEMLSVALLCCNLSLRSRISCFLNVHPNECHLKVL